MSKFCPIADAVTNCTDNCNSCLEEEEKIRRTQMICEKCIHNAVCKYGEARSNGLYCTGEKCKQFQDKSRCFEEERLEKNGYEPNIEHLNMNIDWNALTEDEQITLHNLLTKAHSAVKEVSK